MLRRMVLIVDNNERILSSYGELLEDCGYQVFTARNAHEAEQTLQLHPIDLVIIDKRLNDDSSDLDISGIELAVRPVLRHVPKIMLTGFDLSSLQQRLLWESVGGEPPALMAVVNKNEDPQILINEIKYALENWPKLTLAASRVAKQIDGDHNIIRQQARWYFFLALTSSILGFVMIIAGMLLSIITDTLPSAVIASLTGLVMQAIGYLFLRQRDAADRRMDRYHTELQQPYLLEYLLSLADRLPNEMKMDCIEHIIHSVLDNSYLKMRLPDEPNPVKPAGMK